MLMLATLAAGMSAGMLLLMSVRGVRVAARTLDQMQEQTSRRELADLFIFIDPRSLRLLTAAAVLVCATLALFLTGSLLIAAALGAIALTAPALTWRWLRRRRHRLLTRQLPDALSLLAASLRAGQGLPQSLTQLGQRQPEPLSQELRLLTRKQRLGVPLDRAFAELRARVPGTDYALFATSVRVARELGGNLAETLERLAGSLRRKLAMEDKISALTAQGRIQGLIVGLLPLLLMCVLLLMEPQTMRPLFHSPLGWAVLAVIATLEIAGFLLIRRIVRIEV